jgi:hypothetical protein
LTPVREFSQATGPQCLATLVHTPVELCPSRVCSRFPSALPTCRPAFRLPQVSGPFNGNTQASPMWSEEFSLAPVPLSGFLNPSAVSWQPRASRPCFVPQPVPGILPLERSPRKDRAPLSRPLGSLAVIHRRAEPHCPRRITTRFTDARAFDAVAWIPERLWTPFSRAETRFPFVLGSRSGTDPFRQLHRLRSFTPFANPFATSPGCPDLAADALLGFFPSRVFSVHASRPRPALGLADPEHSPLHPKASGQRPSRPAASRAG